MSKAFFNPPISSSRINHRYRHFFSKERNDEPFFKPAIVPSAHTMPTSNPIQKKQDNGGNLPDDIQMKMENSFGADFSNVNVHENSRSAKGLNAVAYTQGNNIHFAPGHNPYSSQGQEVLGHELTHVIQQSEGRVAATTTSPNGLPVNDDKGLESEADHFGKKAANFNHSASIIQRKCSQCDEQEAYASGETVLNSAITTQPSFQKNQYQSATALQFKCEECTKEEKKLASNQAPPIQAKSASEAVLEEPEMKSALPIQAKSASEAVLEEPEMKSASPIQAKSSSEAVLEEPEMNAAPYIQAKSSSEEVLEEPEMNLSTAVVQKQDAPPVPLQVNITATKDAVILKGENLKLTGQATGGSGRKTYSWASSGGDTFRNDRNSATVKPEATTTYTLTVTDADGASQTSTVQVTVIEDFGVTFAANGICDGVQTTFTLDPNPAIPAVGLARISALLRVQSNPANNFAGNPARQRRLPIVGPNAPGLTYRIDRALWYSTGGGSHCNATSDHNIEVRRQGNQTDMAQANTFTVSASVGAAAGPGTCMSGFAMPLNAGTVANYFTGNPELVFRLLNNGQTRVTLQMGAFRKNVQTTSTWTAPPNSQFTRMLQGEEQYHERQIAGTAGRVIRHLWNAGNVLRRANAAGPFVDANPATAQANALAAFNTEALNEVTNGEAQAFPIGGPFRCRVEAEAKRAVGASYCLAMPCTYSMCP